MNAEAGSTHLAYGLTVDQLDRLQQLTGSLRAQGDVLAISRLRELAQGSLEVIGETIFQVACETRDIVDQIESQRLAEVSASPSPATKGADRPAFDSDIHEALLQAFSVMQLMTIAVHQDNGMDDASGACQLVSELLWRVHEYLAANFDSLPK